LPAQLVVGELVTQLILVTAFVYLVQWGWRCFSRGLVR